MLTQEEKLLCIEKVRRYEIAAAKLRIHETGHSNTGPDVKTPEGIQGVTHYLADVGFPQGGEPWCAAFQFSAIDDQGIDLGFRSASCPVIEAWASRMGILYTQPQAGDFALYQMWDSGGRYSGHIGFVDSVNDDGTFNSIEGNTAPQSGVQDDGGGVYRKKHSIAGWLFVRWVDMVKSVPKFIVLSFAGKLVNCRPTLAGGRVRVEARPLAEALGYSIIRNHGVNTFVNQKSRAHGLSVAIEQAAGHPAIEDGKLRIDLRFLAEGLGFRVDATEFARNGTIVIKSN